MSGKIYLVRHGETYWNNLGIMHGQTDIPLNETGKEQAKNLAKNMLDIQLDICYCSPLQRAIFTAVEILKFHKNTPLIYDNRLMEIYKGKLEGTSNNSEELLKNEPLELLIKYNIESKSHYFKRIKNFFDEILPQNKDKNILIVSHSGTVKMSKFYFEPPEKNIVEEWYNVHIKNCELIVIDNKMPTKLPKLVEYNVDKERYPLI